MGPYSPFLFWPLIELLFTFLCLVTHLLSPLGPLIWATRLENKNILPREMLAGEPHSELLPSRGRNSQTSLFPANNTPQATFPLVVSGNSTSLRSLPCSPLHFTCVSNKPFCVLLYVCEVICLYIWTIFGMTFTCLWSWPYNYIKQNTPLAGYSYIDFEKYIESWVHHCNWNQNGSVTTQTAPATAFFHAAPL